MTKNIFLVLFMLLFLSCTRETANQDKSETKIDSGRESLKGTVLQLPVLSENPIAIYHSPFGLIIVPAFKDGVVQLIDTTSGKVLTSQFTRGKGPYELLNPIAMDYNSKDSTFCIWDLGKQSFNLYKLSPKGFDFYKTTSYSGINPSLVRNLNDSLNVILTSIPNQSLIIHNQKGVQSSIPYQILKEPDLDYYYNYYPSEIDVCPKLNMIFTADPYLPYLAAFKYSDKKIKKLWDKMLLKPKYTIKKRWRYILEDSYLGFRWISVSNQFIYLTPYGITRAQWEKGVHKEIETTRLMIFDFEGNLVKELTLDHNVDYITVSPDDRVLYGITERPDRFIVKYHLK